MLLICFISVRVSLYLYRLLLRHCICEKYFDLVTLNAQIRDLDLGYNDNKDRPTHISRDILDRDDKLGQRGITENHGYVTWSVHLCLLCIAAQSWCLAVNLPLLIGDSIPYDDSHYKCFLILLAILSISMAVTVRPDDACLLASMIEDHHQRFRQLYSERPITPKMHYLIHLPNQLLRYVQCLC